MKFKVDEIASILQREIADDQFALSAANGNHRIDGLDAGLQRLFDGLPVGDVRGDDINLALLAGLDGRPAINRLTQRIDHPPEQFRANRHRQELARGTDHVTFLDQFGLAEDHCTDRFLLQVEYLAKNLVGKFQHFPRHGLA